MLISGNKTTILFDGNTLPGLKTFTYKVFRKSFDARTLNDPERKNILLGDIHIFGQIIVNSNSPYLNALLEYGKTFQIIITAKSADSENEKTFTKLIFDNCTIADKEFVLDAHDLGYSIYTFTATRVREEG